MRQTFWKMPIVVVTALIAALTTLVLSLHATSAFAVVGSGGDPRGCPISQKMGLFEDNFEDGDSNGWRLDPMWAIEQEDGNHLLSGSGHTWANLTEERYWTEYNFEVRVKLIRGAVHLNYRLSRNGRYFIGFSENGLSLSKSVMKDPLPPPGEDAWNHFSLTSIEEQFDLNTWHTVKIAGTGARIQIYVDGELKIDYADAINPHLAGSIAFETLDDSHVHFDDVKVVGQVCTELTWQRMGNLLGGGIMSLEVAPTSPNVVFFLTNVNDLGAWRSTDAGARWSRVFQGTHGLGVAIHPVDPQMMLVLGGHGSIYKTADGGTSWDEVFRDGSKDLTDLAYAPTTPNVVYAGTWGGEILKSTDGGSNWITVATGLALVAALSVSPTSPDVVYAGTDNGIIRSINGGATWINKGLAGRRVISLAAHPTNEAVLYAASDNGLHKTTDSGANWTLTGLSGQDLHRVAVAPSDPQVIYAGGHNGVFRSMDGGATWTAANSGLKHLDIGGLAVSPADPNTAYVGTGLWQWIPYHSHFPGEIFYDEGIYKTTDGGVSWVKLDGDFADDDVIVVALDSSAPNTLYAGTECSRGAYRSTDGGLTWGLLPGGDSSTAGDLAHYTMSIVVSTAPPHPVYLTGRFGIAKSLNQGVTWQSLSYRRHFHGIAIDPTDSQTVYVGTTAEDDPTESNVYPDAHIFKTTNGGQAWQEMDNGFPNGAKTAIHSIVIDPSTPGTIYLATTTHEHGAATVALGIYKTTDGGLTWVSANNGLKTSEVMVLAIDPSDPDVLYAGTADGVFKSVDGARNWTHISLQGISVHDLVIDPNIPSRVYAGSEAGIFKTNDGGDQWYPVNFGLSLTDVRSLALEPTGDVLFAAIRGGGVFRAKIGPNRPPHAPEISFPSDGSLDQPLDLTLDWTGGDPDVGDAVTYDVYFGSSDQPLLVSLGQSGTAYHPDPLSPSTHYLWKIVARDAQGEETEGPLWNFTTRAELGGTVSSWEQTYGPGGGIIRAFTISSTNPQALYVGTPDAGIFRSKNGGQSWEFAMQGVQGNFIFHLAVDPDNPSIVYAAFVNGGLYKSADGGSSWVPLNANIQAFSIVIDPTNTNVLYVGTQNGKIYKSTNGGASWVEKSSGLPNQEFSVSKIIVDPSNPQRVYAATGWWDDVRGAGLFKSEDGGDTWQAINQGFPGKTVSTLAMDPTDPQVLYAANDDGPSPGLYKTTDGGARWERVLDGYLVSVAIGPTNSNIVYVGGHGGHLYKSSDKGQTWAHLGGINDLKGFVPLVVTTHLLVDPQSPQTIYAGGYHNGLAKSTDGGLTWKYINEGLVVSWVHSLAIDPGNKNVVYAGTMGDGIFKTTDGGSRWERLSQSYELIGGGAIAIDPQNPDVVYVGTEYGFPGRVFKSTNGGQSWNKILEVDQDNNFSYHNGLVSAIVIDPSNTDVVYAAIAEAFNASRGAPGIYKSTDGGQNWSLMNSGLTSLRITSMVIDLLQPNILYVGTDAGVFKSTNGGQSWQASSTGLTNPWIQALAIDPRQPHILYAGARDGMIFRSTNAGASWALVYNNPNFRWDTPWITPFDEPGEIGSLAIDPVNSDIIYAGVMGLPFLVISNDGGTSWSEISHVPAVHTVAISSNGEKVYTGTIGWGAFVLPSSVPAISVSPGSQDFGNVDVGNSAELSFTVQNTGVGTLTGSASTFSPFSIVSGGSFSLGAGASQAMVVRFSPTTAGTFMGHVNFTSNGSYVSRVVTGTGTITNPALTVTKTGSGSGTVTSSHAGIECGTDCSESYANGTSVTLTATPAAGSTFAGWRDACSGAGPCTLSMDHERTATAIFTTPLTIGSSALEGEVGVVYHGSLGISGGLPRYSISVAKGALPLGLSLDSEDIIGAPAKAGSSSFTVQVTDDFGSSVSKKLGMKIFNALNISTRSLKRGRVGKKYNALLKVTGGKKPYAWSLISESLPEGLSLESSTGKITGIPAASGSFNLTFQMTDALDGVVSKSFLLNIN